MRRLLVFFAFCALLVSSLAIAAPSSAAPIPVIECFHLRAKITNSNDDPITIEFGIDAYDGYTRTAKIAAHTTRTFNLYHTVGVVGTVSPYIGIVGGTSADLTLTGPFALDACAHHGSDDGGGSGAPAEIGDGRINDGADQLGAPLAAYCLADGSISVWDIAGDGAGSLGFTVSAAQISSALAAAKSSGQNQLIASGLGDSLYALTSNELEWIGPEVHDAGKIYTFVAPGTVCSPPAA